MGHFAKTLSDISARLKAEGRFTFDARVAEYNKVLRAEESRLAEAQETQGGLEGGRLRAEMIDDWLCHLMEEQFDALAASGKKVPRLALVALGGYGRRELNPKSDIDLTFLHAGGAQLPPGVEQIVKESQHIIYACDYTPSCPTRSLDETMAEANKEMQSRTAMLEARLLYGDKELFARFEQRFQKECVSGHADRYLKARVEDQAARHAKYGHTVYMQEPNIKNGCGGLRDFQNLMWMAYFKYGVRTTGELVEKKYLNEAEQREIDSAYEWIFHLRTELHQLTQRHTDVIMVNQQCDLADRLGYKEKFPDVLRRTEAFMRDYYNHARAIYEITELVSERLALPMPDEPKPRGFFNFLPFRRHKAKHEEFDGFVAYDGRMHYQHRHIFREDKPRMMRLFHHVQQRGLRMSPELRQLVRRRLKYVDATFLHMQENREVFIEILRHKGEVGHVLRAMHRVDFLGKWMPEFGSVTALVQHEFFHRYTVDEHTLVCIEKLDTLLDTDEKKFEGYKELFQKVEDTSVLYLALLLHDTGKAANSRHHNDVSAENASKVAKRLRFSRDQRQMLTFLVDSHDILAKTARQRDLQDESTIEEFAGIVQKQEWLDALMLITVADGLGVGDDKLWNDWTQSLVWQLYRSASQFFADSDGFHKQRQVERHDLLASVSKQLPSDYDLELSAHFEAMPDRYFQNNIATNIAAHIRMFREFLETRWASDEHALSPVIRWESRENAGHSKLHIVTWDRQQLLARICGALAATELNILSADIFTRSDGLVLDVFRVSTTRYEAVEDKRDIAKVERLLNESLKGERYDFAPLLSKTLSRKQAVVLDFPTRITINTESHPLYTVVDILSPDRLGLLYELLCTIGDAGFQIAAARIATEKGAAIDSFYLTDNKGRKVTDSDWLRSLREALSGVTSRAI